ncbi:MAG: hypothetical protein KA314_23105 [Chloroflexi bacterium]|nr:hypothetical protein [Chloroflexota bacterium]
MTTEKPISRDEAIHQIATQLEGPISLEVFTEQVLALWHSTSKTASTTVHRAIRNYEQGKTIVFVDETTILPIHLALAGVCMRVPLSRQEIKKGQFYLFPAFNFLLPDNVEPEKTQLVLVDKEDHTLPTEIVTWTEEARSIFGPYKRQMMALNLSWWYRKHKVKRDDSVLLTILDWKTSKFRLQVESARERGRYRADIATSNQLLADTLFDLLENSPEPYLFGRMGILTAYTRLKGKITVPADHWLLVMEKDGRMRWDGSLINYSETPGLAERIVPELRPQRSSHGKTKLSTEEAQQVYRFKVSLKHRKTLWRQIEIQGGQTLGEFDRELRGAFDHDFFDHMSGFWQIIPRGNTSRTREVDLGNINPLGEGDAAAVKIASLNLKPGDKLKYVYDFGDWIEHVLEVEAVAAAEPEITYPLVTAQNKPRYKYCSICKEEGRKTIAKYLCIDCSNRYGREVILCETCTPEHDDHYLDEILY